MGGIRFFDGSRVDYIEPAKAYPPEILPLIPPKELAGSRVKIHHPGTAVEPQLFEVEAERDLELASHAHESTEIIVVLEGELHFGSRQCPVGSSILVPGGTLYSVRAGPEGARFLNFRGAADYTYVNKEGFLAARRVGGSDEHDAR